MGALHLLQAERIGPVCVSGILFFNPAQYYFIHDHSRNIEFYPVILVIIEFNPFARKKALVVNTETTMPP